jgi:hypothetical protein
MIGPVRQIAQEGSTDKTDSSFIMTFATGSDDLSLIII